MQGQDINAMVNVHCRLGSLENQWWPVQYRQRVHCRLGSLEMNEIMLEKWHEVHCRLGSLEKHYEAERAI